MNFQTYQTELETLLPQITKLHDDFLRVLDLGSDYKLVCTLEIPSFDFDIRLTDSTYETVKLLDGVPPDVLHKYSGHVIAIQKWIEDQTTEFPIPVNKEEVGKFENINTPVETLDSESPLSEYTI